MNAMLPGSPLKSRRSTKAPKIIRGVISPTGVRQVKRYLLPSESLVITTRRHWILIAEPIASAIATGLLGLSSIFWLGDRAAWLVNLLLLAAIGVFLRAVIRYVDWARDWFVVTDERLLLAYGLLTRRVAVMPLTKVTDLSYNVSFIGRFLGYGEFVFESAGQDQALHTIDHLARSGKLFTVLSEELFGVGGIASSRGLRSSSDADQSAD